MFVQKFKFILMKMHKNCCHQSCSFWAVLAQIWTKPFVGWGFALDPTGGAYNTPPDPLAGLGGGAPGEREGRTRGEKEGGKGKEGEGVQECPGAGQLVP